MRARRTRDVARRKKSRIEEVRMNNGFLACRDFQNRDDDTTSTRDFHSRWCVDAACATADSPFRKIFSDNVARTPASHTDRDPNMRIGQTDSHLASRETSAGSSCGGANDVQARPTTTRTVMLRAKTLPPTRIG
jgi:hypothetical protein